MGRPYEHAGQWSARRPGRNGRPAILGTGLLLLAGCAATQPMPAPPNPPAKKAHVAYRAVADKHLKHYRIDPSQSTISPEPRADNPAPIYPADLVRAGLPPVTVTALLIVDAQGRVKAVRIAPRAPAGATQRRFDAAVRKATLQWRFAPLRIADWVTDAQGNERRVSADPKPFSQTYRFQFEVKDGQPQVSGAVPAPRKKLSGKPTVDSRGN